MQKNGAWTKQNSGDRENRESFFKIGAHSAESRCERMLEVVKKETSVETEVEPKLTAYEKDLIYS
jgi:hypothetical protein